MKNKQIVCIHRAETHVYLTLNKTYTYIDNIDRRYSVINDAGVIFYYSTKYFKTLHKLRHETLNDLLK
jgi:hypothetical protein